MIFITRDLYNACQDGSSWERRAQRQWNQRCEIHRCYYHIISPLLPPAVRRLCGSGLHDALVESATQTDGTLVLVMDATNALSDFRGRRLRLAFRGLRRRIPVRGLRGQWWLYNEAHLSSKARFSLHVMFDKSDVEIEADELLIERA